MENRLGPKKKSQPKLERKLTMKNPNLPMITTFLLLLSAGLFAQENEKVPYVPSPIEVVDRMVERVRRTRSKSSV